MNNPTKEVQDRHSYVPAYAYQVQSAGSLCAPSACSPRLELHAVRAIKDANYLFLASSARIFNLPVSPGVKIGCASDI
jgi:hypothetical protein